MDALQQGVEVEAVAGGVGHDDLHVDHTPVRQRRAQRFQQLGYEVIGDTPEEYRATLKADTDLYGRMVKKLGIKGGN